MSLRPSLSTHSSFSVKKNIIKKADDYFRKWKPEAETAQWQRRARSKIINTSVKLKND